MRASGWEVGGKKKRKRYDSKVSRTANRYAIFCEGSQILERLRLNLRRTASFHGRRTVLWSTKAEDTTCVLVIRALESAAHLGGFGTTKGVGFLVSSLYCALKLQ